MPYDIDRTARRYTGIGMMIIIFFWMVGILVSTLMPQWELMNPIWVSVGFSCLSLVVISLVWRYVAKNNPDMLTSFYTAVSGFRMLLALAVLTVCYFIVGRDAMVPYVLVFMVFYLLMVGFHSVYFARVTNRQ